MLGRVIAALRTGTVGSSRWRNRYQAARCAASTAGKSMSVSATLFMTFVRRNCTDKATIDDHIDMAVRLGALPDSSLVAVRVGSVRRVVCGSPGYFAAHGAPKTPADLVGLTCVTFADLAAGPSWAFAARGRSPQQPVPIRCRPSITTAEAAIDAAIAGVGITHILSYQAAGPVERGPLRIVLEEFETDPMPISVIHTGQPLQPLELRRLLEFAVPRLQRSLATPLTGAWDKVR
jgi:DNA-binding transcriptional LysR family regulator